jgi:hypothetical protein
MSVDAGDFVDNILDEQARRNAAFVDQPDSDDTVEDFQNVPAIGNELMGFGTETVTATAQTTPFVWGTFVWGFSTWS